MECGERRSTAPSPKSIRVGESEMLGQRSDPAASIGMQVIMWSALGLLFGAAAGRSSLGKQSELREPGLTAHNENPTGRLTQMYAD